MNESRFSSPSGKSSRSDPSGNLQKANRRLDGLVLLLLGAVGFLAIGIAWQRLTPIAMGDFKVVYYSARCLLQHGDPYNQSDVMRVYRAEGREPSIEPTVDREVKTRFFYPPTAFIVTVPFALLGFEVGKIAWMVISAGILILAAILMWDLTAGFASTISGALLGFLLVNSFWLFMIGNSSALAVGLCVIAVWCFLRRRFVSAGVMCLVISLALKPNDSGLVWLFLLLAGTAFRKRALQALAVLVLMSLPILASISHVAPHWRSELTSNMASFGGVGGNVDPTATGKAGKGMDSIIQLQSDVSIFLPDQHEYDLVTYLICAPILIVWAVTVVRRRPDGEYAWIALAVAAPITMLPTYHYQHDAKILLLCVPACVLLWSKRGRFGWLSVLITGAAILINGDMFSAIRILLTRRFVVPQPNFRSQMMTVLLTRPAPLILLATAVFYLWVYVQYRSLKETQVS